MIWDGWDIVAMFETCLLSIVTLLTGDFNYFNFFFFYIGCKLT